MDLIQVLQLLDAPLSVLVLVYFLNKLANQVADTTPYVMRLIDRLLDLCADRDGSDPPAPSS